jgi:hypothetical protein
MRHDDGSEPRLVVRERFREIVEVPRITGAGINQHGFRAAEQVRVVAVASIWARIVRVNECNQHGSDRRQPSTLAMFPSGAV